MKATKTTVCGGFLAAILIASAPLTVADDAHKHHTLPATPAALSGDSLYQLESVWRGQHGALQPLRVLAGRPVVAAMIYTSCEFACPLIVRDMLAIQRALGDGEQNAAQFVLFSFDPARDTPAAMRDYAANKRLPAPHWTLLAADDDATRELAVALGVRYRPIAGGDFAHSNIVFVLNCGGEVTHRQEGLGLPPAPAVAAIHAAAENCGG